MDYQSRDGRLGFEQLLEWNYYSACFLPALMSLWMIVVAQWYFEDDDDQNGMIH